jgi:integrase
MRFSDRGIAALKPRVRAYDVREARGFTLRVWPNGTKSWHYVYDLHRKRRRFHLGTYPLLSVEAARQAHEHARAQRAQGIDPSVAAAEARTAAAAQAVQEAASAPTVAWLVAEYIERWAKRRKRTWREDERILRKYILPHWGDRQAASITRRDVNTLLDSLIDGGMGAGANRVFAITRKMFNFALARDFVSASPCHQVKAPAPEHRRDRVLTADEIRAFWTGLDDALLPPGTRSMLRLALLTAQRIGEIAGARWDEFDLDAGWWTIPAERAKNKLAHRVPLTKPVLRIIAEARWTSQASPYVFPAHRAGQPVRVSTIGHALREWLTSDQRPAGLAAFTAHDLRRTAASHMTSLGTPRLVVAKILNHAEPGVTATYDRHAYDAEKRDALNRWATHLETRTKNHERTSAEA